MSFSEGQLWNHKCYEPAVCVRACNKIFTVLLYTRLPTTLYVLYATFTEIDKLKLCNISLSRGSHDNFSNCGLLGGFLTVLFLFRIRMQKLGKLCWGPSSLYKGSEHPRQLFISLLGKFLYQDFFTLQTFGLAFYSHLNEGGKFTPHSSDSSVWFVTLLELRKSTRYPDLGLRWSTGPWFSRGEGWVEPGDTSWWKVLCQSAVQFQRRGHDVPWERRPWWARWDLTWRIIENKWLLVRSHLTRDT